MLKEEIKGLDVFPALHKTKKIKIEKTIKC